MRCIVSRPNCPKCDDNNDIERSKDGFIALLMNVKFISRNHYRIVRIANLLNMCENERRKLLNHCNRSNHWPEWSRLEQNKQVHPRRIWFFEKTQHLTLGKTWTKDIGMRQNESGLASILKKVGSHIVPWLFSLAEITETEGWLWKNKLTNTRWSYWWTILFASWSQTIR